MDGDDYGRDMSGNGGYGDISTDIQFGSSGDTDYSRGPDYSNDNRSYSIEQREDNQTNWNQGPFTTSCAEPDKATFITVNHFSNVY